MQGIGRQNSKTHKSASKKIREKECDEMYYAPDSREGGKGEEKKYCETCGQRLDKYQMNLHRAIHNNEQYK